MSLPFPLRRRCPRFPPPNAMPAARSRTLRGFYPHLMVFAVVNTGLLAINLIASPGRLWFYWPLLGWGIWLALHAVGTFGRGRWLGAEWEERKLRELHGRQGREIIHPCPAFFPR